MGGESISLRAAALSNQMAVLVTMPVVWRLEVKIPTSTHRDKFLY